MGSLSKVIIGGLVGLVVLGVILYGFNKLPISLPGLNKSSPAISQQLKLTLSCPVDKKPCPKGNLIEKKATDSAILGIGFSNLSAGDKLLALSQGRYLVEDATPKEQKDIKISSFTIQDRVKGLSIQYIFQGQVSPPLDPDQVKLGEEIGTLEGKTFGKRRFNGLYQLVILVTDSKSNKYLKLQSQNDGLAVVE